MNSTVREIADSPHGFFVVISADNVCVLPALMPSLEKFPQPALRHNAVAVCVVLVSVRLEHLCPGGGERRAASLWPRRTRAVDLRSWTLRQREEGASSGVARHLL